MSDHLIERHWTPAKGGAEIKTVLNLQDIASLIVDECESATQKFGTFNSYHEGCGVLREEFEELWDEVKKKTPDKAKLKAEAIQVGAMAMRFIHDLCGGT